MPTARIISTPRITVNTLTCGDPAAEVILFIHGNLSSSVFWEQTMAVLGDDFFCVAPDLRGFGATEPLKIDATLGLNDMAEDILALIAALKISRFHLVGHSMGGGVAMKMLLLRPDILHSVTLVNTISPYGYAGSVDEWGTPCHPDGSPGGAGYVDAEFIRRLTEGDRSKEHALSPRNVLERLYFRPPFVPDNIDQLVDAVLATHVGDDWYPGNAVASPFWQGLAPGERGVVNAFSARYFDASEIASIQPKPPLLWIRGVDDLIIRNEDELQQEETSPGGSNSRPAQPMLRQIRRVLEGYRSKGGVFKEQGIADAGHTPFLEKPAEFNQALVNFLSSIRQTSD
ncbi:MAG: alpha/beta hydrolase [Gammaproteobacteria bacterium]|nr:alpha/beta hydrolase [Gammaproteobacteria bacterium]MCY4210058.1 alpha/beta hydrolase [Gammaproteobacteria bacterium]MCY4281524.1 alpha/beta hydrolase [Gammaproteobacteria bacterium]MCY4337418.1 alpha/beta hydrolase [Gammaproteobacteria bacterium]